MTGESGSGKHRFKMPECDPEPTSSAAPHLVTKSLPAVGPVAATIPSAEMPRVLGIDIGGANLKFATTHGDYGSTPFAMWLRPRELSDRLLELAGCWPFCDTWAVTMTGEMADIFSDRDDGVRQIASQVGTAAKVAGVSRLRFYRVDGRFVGLGETLRAPRAVASANWHALASWVARCLPSPSLLIDVGGTTTDIIPIAPADKDWERPVATSSRTDFDRLVAGELVYLGGVRTPVCALVDSLSFRGRRVPVMREVFATTDDCAVVLGLCPPAPDDYGTSDGGPRTVAAAVNRLSRMIGLDGRDVDLDGAAELATAVIAAATERLAEAIRRQPDCHADRWVISGHTADYFLPDLRRWFPGVKVERLVERLPPVAVAGTAGLTAAGDQIAAVDPRAAASRVAPALAVAHLAAVAERSGR